jgi:hypothetical protein
LGFHRVETVDDDLGISGSGFAERPGFQRLLTTVCAGTAGAVLALEASRLARNDRDWSQLVELGAITNVVLIDHDGIYDPRLVNDRLLLGINRPDSNSTSYSSSRRSANSVEITPRVIAAFGPSLTSYARPWTDYQAVRARRTTISVSESSPSPP